MLRSDPFTTAKVASRLPSRMPTPRERFARERPGQFFLDADADALQAYLVAQGLVPRQGLLRRRPRVSDVEVLPGGNMNCTVRVRFADGRAPFGASVVIKQARPWVERYPSIAAPVERARQEAGYLRLVGFVDALAAASPRLLHYDPGAQLLVLTDLGPVGDLSDLYAGVPLDRRLPDGRPLLQGLVDYLTALHGHFARTPPARPVVNRAMRALNHEHVFALPFRENNGLDLETFAPGLSTAADGIVTDELRARVTALGECYLDPRAGGTLLHGDFYPGSFVLDEAGELFVIDPEFCFTGPPEWDFGVFAAHLHLSGHGDRVTAARAYYPLPLDNELWRGFAGAELLRRVLGVAQLPLAEHADRAGLLALGKRLVLGASILWILILTAIGCVPPEPRSETVAPPAYGFDRPVVAAYLPDSTRLDSAEYADRVLGALVGSALGDAMGAGTEMWPRSEIYLRYGYLTGLAPAIRPRSPEGVWQHNAPAGATTDDTRWKRLAVDYLSEATAPSPAAFATFLADYYRQQAVLLGAEALAGHPDAVDARVEQLDWIKEWARVAMAYETGPEAFATARSRFYGGEMSCAGMLYAPVLGLVAPTPDSAYHLAYRHSLFDHGYGRDVAALTAAMTQAATQTESVDAVLDVATYVDPLGFGDSRLVGRIALAIAQDARVLVRRARDMPLPDTLLDATGRPQRIPAGYPHGPEEWARQAYVYHGLDEDAEAIAFHAGEVWRILVAGLAWGEGDVERTLQFIVNYGRDNDTVAAVAGAVLGAQVGYGGLPPKLAAAVATASRERMGIDLERAAVQLVARTFPG